MKRRISRDARVSIASHSDVKRSRSALLILTINWLSFLSFFRDFVSPDMVTSTHRVIMVTIKHKNVYTLLGVTKAGRRGRLDAGHRVSVMALPLVHSAPDTDLMGCYCFFMISCLVRVAARWRPAMRDAVPLTALTKRLSHDRLWGGPHPANELDGLRWSELPRTDPG